ncbi:hypothetical protein [Streptomyces spinosirectus]
MNLRKRVFTVAVLAGTAFGGLGVPAMAAPMPWETSKTPTAVTHHATPTAADTSGTVTARCVGGCYQ